MKILKLDKPPGEGGKWEEIAQEDWIRIEVDGCLYDIQADMTCSRGGIKMEGGLQVMGVDNRIFAVVDGETLERTGPREVLSGQNGHLKLWMHTANNFTIGPR